MAKNLSSESNSRNTKVFSYVKSLKKDNQPCYINFKSLPVDQSFEKRRPSYSRITARVNLKADLLENK